MYSSSDLECQRIVAGVALRGIENLTCTHACASVSTTLGRLHLTMAATGCAKMYGTHATRRPDHAHEPATSTDPRTCPG